jgi:PAS domain S-box-containing protein
MKKSSLSKTELRKQAEEKLGQQNTAAIPETGADTQRLLHELQVHQIELEIQNEELVQSQTEVEAGLRQFSDLYDFAPVGYFTLARDGAIHQVNLTGAYLLGIERGELIKRRFGVFVAVESLSVYNDFLEKVFSAGGKKQTCEVELLKDKTESLFARIDAYAAQDIDDAPVCRATMIDITERKQKDDEIRKINEGMEQTIKERTKELRENIDLLEETNRAFVGRELRIIELKERIAKLEKKK